MRDIGHALQEVALFPRRSSERTSVSVTGQQALWQEQFDWKEKADLERKSESEVVYGD